MIEKLVEKLFDAALNLLTGDTLPLFLLAALLAWAIHLLARGRQA